MFLLTMFPLSSVYVFAAHNFTVWETIIGNVEMMSSLGRVLIPQTLTPGVQKSDPSVPWKYSGYTAAVVISQLGGRRATHLGSPSYACGVAGDRWLHSCRNVMHNWRGLKRSREVHVEANSELFLISVAWRTCVHITRVEADTQKSYRKQVGVSKSSYLHTC